MPDLWYEKQVDGSLKPLSLSPPNGEADGSGGYIPLQISHIGDPLPDSTPLAPTLSATLSSRTQADLTWVAPDNTGRPPITDYRVYRSTDGGADTLVHTTTLPAALSWSETGLPTSTGPEKLFVYSVYAVNADGVGDVSNLKTLQWGSAPTQAPTAPTNLTRTGLLPTQATLHWAETADPTVTKHGVFLNTTLFRDNLDPVAVDYVLSGLTANTAYNQVNVRRWNSYNGGSWSPASNVITFTTPTVAAPAFTMLMGASVPENQPVGGPNTGITWPPSSGGQTQWDAIRVYHFNEMIQEWTQWSPKVIGQTDANTAIHGLQPSADALKSALDDFYYPGGTYNNRNGCEVHFANGNEYGTDVTNLANFVDTVRRMSLVINLAGAQAGGRRYPLASMWLDPTHFQEKAPPANYPASLMQSAPYLNGIAWSMYPPGRTVTQSGNGSSLTQGANPTFTKPTLTATATGGHLERCFQRVKLASQASTNPSLGGVDRVLKIAIWEIGIGDDPTDRDHRPYYAMNSIAKWVYERCLDPDMLLEMPVAMWWDQNKGTSGDAENVLSDEPAATSPSTALAWKNWQSYDPTYGGVKPSNWPNAPKSTWPTGA